MKSIKKIVSVFLCILTIFNICSVSVSVFAQGLDETNEESPNIISEETEENE